MLGFCGVVGILMAVFNMHFLKYGIGILGCGAGVAIGLILTNLFRVNNQAIFYALIIVPSLLFGLLTFKQSDAVMIFSTALIGSYCLVRGVSFYLGGYPNEFDLVYAMQEG